MGQLLRQKYIIKNIINKHPGLSTRLDSNRTPDPGTARRGGNNRIQDQVAGKRGASRTPDRLPPDRGPRTASNTPDRARADIVCQTVISTSKYF